jgi:hypothetical protein
MALKVDGTNSKLIFLAGSAQETTLTSSATATPWTLTLPPNPGLAGQVLTTDGSGNLSWGAGASTINVANDITTNAARYPLFANTTSGTLTTVYTGNPEYTFNPSTGVLSAAQMYSTQGIHLNANTITANYTVPANTNGLSGGPMTVPAGITVNLGPGANWTIV